jgi:pyruvate dehydrogenase (quinone)/pyruvate oxidase
VVRDDIVIVDRALGERRRPLWCYRARQLIEATVDPNEPPLPPKATFEQTKNLVEALARGTPDAGQIARNIALGKIRELI